MVELHPGEAVVKTGPVRWVGREGERPGTLTLTNRALIFEGPIPQRPPEGPMGAGSAAGRGGGGVQRPAGPPTLIPGTLRIPLWRCRGAAAIPGPSGSDLGIQLLQRSLLLRTNEADAWAPAIRQARASAPPPPPGVMGMKGAPGAADPPCEHCGKPNPAGSAFCGSCGAPLHT